VGEKGEVTVTVAPVNFVFTSAGGELMPGKIAGIV
jgi:hypothetical protein